MRWTMGRRSDNVEDRRGSGPGMPLVAGGGIGSIILVLVALYFGIDPSVVLQGGGQPAPTTQAPAAPSRGGDEIKQFVSVVLADTEDTWRQLFRRMNREYRDPTLVLFSGIGPVGLRHRRRRRRPVLLPGRPEASTSTSTFFRRAPRPLRRARRLRPGLRHRPRGRPPRPEPARHLRARRRRRASRSDSRGQRAVGPAGAAGRLLRRRLGPPRPARPQHPRAGDVEEAPRRRHRHRRRPPADAAPGRVVPESFTHGSSAQRVHWFRRGFDSGEIRQCDTFASSRP